MSTAKPKYKGVKFTTPTGRFSFPALFESKLKYQSQTEKEYSTQFLFDENTDLKLFNMAIDSAIAEVFGKDKTKWPKNISRPLVDQEVQIEKAIEKGYGHDHLVPGAFYMTAKSSAKFARPIIVDEQRAELLDPTKLYGGAYGKLSVQMKINQIKGTDPVTKKATLSVYVTPYLQGVQVDTVRGGDSFGGRPNVNEMFEPVVYGDDEMVDPTA